MAKYPGVCSAIAEAIGGDPPPIGAIQDLARKLDRDQSVVGRWVGGKSSPDSAAWPEIERVLGMAPGTLKAASLRPSATERDDYAATLEELADLRETVAQLAEVVDSIDLRVVAVEQELGGSAGRRSRSDE